MTRYWIRRILQSIPLLLGSTVIVFVILQLAPGDPTSFIISSTPKKPSPETIERLKEHLGLNDPLPVQYVKTTAGIFTGNIRSLVRNRPAVEMVLGAIPVTLSIVLVANIIGWVVAFPVGLVAGSRPGGVVDNLLSGSLMLFVSVPRFVVGLLMIRLFSEALGWLPSGGIRPLESTSWNPIEMAPYVIMPALVTSLFATPILARYIRDAVDDVMGEDYVRTAHAKGLSNNIVLSRHVLRNVLVPVISVSGIVMPLQLGSAIIVEQLFFLPGLGRLTVQAALGRDYPVIMTAVLASAIIVVVANLLVDYLYGVVDPRIRLR